jgi:similar to stage IV sporulation protein
LVLPFELVIDRFYEKTNVERSMNVEEAKNHAAVEAFNNVINTIPDDAEIVNKTLNFVQKNDSGLTADIIIECLEEIGSSETIGGE